MQIYSTVKIYWQRPTARSSVLYCIANYNPPAAGNLYIHRLTWSYVGLFILAGVRGYFQIEVTHGVQSVTVYSLRYCVVCLYLCPIRTLSLLRVFKITLQIYFVQGMEAINGKQTIVQWYTSVRIGRTSARVIGVNPKLSITIGNFPLVQ